MARPPAETAASHGLTTSERHRNPLSAATWACVSIVAAAELYFLNVDSVAAIFAAAVIFGWTEVNGLCGTSHMGTVTPMSSLGRHRLIWLRTVSAYTVGGIVTSALVGTLLGWLGQLSHLRDSRALYGVLSVVALVLIARELHLLEFELPQYRRQTQKMWQFQFGITTAAAMWGAHIGLGVATVISHGGFFIVVGCAIALGPVAGALLMIVYWVSRTLPLWVAPLLVRNAAEGAAITDDIICSPRTYRLACAVGLVCASVAIFELAGASILS